MQDWKEKSLSQAGKEVLIKAIIQAIPSYSMNCLLFPISTCQDIERATSRFFWGSTLEDRRCHWAAWDVLTTSKANGGLGFKELHYFNLAMLAKQLWTLSQHPNSLAYRLFKSKYFPKSGIMQANVGYNPSYIWRSLLAAKELVQEGEAWRIGNGSMVSIGEDRWIGVENKKKSSGVLRAEFYNRRVISLINTETGQWDSDLIQQVFNNEEAEQIKRTPLSRTLPADKRVWRFTSHGLFTVRTAYHIAVEKFSTIHDHRPTPSVIPDEWKKIWHIDVIPRVKMFLWRACANALPTKMNLRQRGCEVDAMCVVCGEREETIDHLFMKCKPVAKVWYGSVLRIDVNRELNNTFRAWFWGKLKNFPKDYVGLFAYTMWEIWKRRNSVIFDGKVFDIWDVISRAYSQWNEFMKGAVKLEPKENNADGAIQWVKPQQGLYKLNCDVAVLGDGKIGMGFVVRGHDGQVCLAGKHECIASGSSTLLESIAMRFACERANQYKLRVHVIECDSKILTDSLNSKGLAPAYCDVIVEDIRDLAR